MILKSTVPLLAVVVLVACGEQPAARKAGTPSLVAPAMAAPAPLAPVAARRGLDSATVARGVARGGEIYKANCAVCHGASAEGAPNWHQKGPDGKYPPPPLNASGHGWHHPMSALVQAIKEGTVQRGGGMPAWGDKLKDEEIEAVIAWFQSRWPEEVYKSWAFMDEKARRGLVRH